MDIEPIFDAALVAKFFPKDIAFDDFDSDGCGACSDPGGTACSDPGGTGCAGCSDPGGAGCSDPGCAGCAGCSDPGGAGGSGCAGCSDPGGTGCAGCSDPGGAGGIGCDDAISLLPPVNVFTKLSLSFGSNGTSFIILFNNSLFFSSSDISGWVSFVKKLGIIDGICAPKINK